MVGGALTEDTKFRWSSVALPAFGPSILFGVAQGALIPVILHSAIERGATTALAAFIAGLIGLGMLVADVPSGALVQRFGEKRAMLVAMASAMLGLALCLLPVADGPFGVLMYAAGVTFVGMAGSVFSLARQTYLTELVPMKMRARALSTLGGSMRVGMFLGPFLGAGLTVLMGSAGSYVIGLVALAASGIIVATGPDLDVKPAARHGEGARTMRGVFRQYRHVYATLGIGIMMLAALRQTRQAVVPLWATQIGLSPAETSLIYGVGAALDALVFYPAGWVMDRYGRRIVAVASALLLGVSFVLIPLASGPVLLTVFACVLGVGNGIGSGLVMTLGADACSGAERPIFLGIWRGMSDSGAAAGPLLLSGLTAVAGPAVGIVACGMFGFAASGVFGRWVPKRAQ